MSEQTNESLRNFQDAINSTVYSVREVRSVMIDELVSALDNVSVAIQKTSSTIEEHQTVQEKLAKQFNKVRKSMEPMLTLKQKILKGVGDVFKTLGKAAKTGFGGMKDALGQFIDFAVLMEPLSLIFAPINDIISIFVGAMEQSLQPAIEELYSQLLSPEAIALWIELGHIMGDAVAPAIYTVTDLFQQLIAAGIIQDFTNFLIDNHDAIADFLSGMLMLIPPLIEQGMQLVTILLEVQNGFKTAEAAGAEILGLFVEIGTALTGISEELAVGFGELGATWSDTTTRMGDDLNRWAARVSDDWNRFWNQASTDFNTWAARVSDDWNRAWSQFGDVLIDGLRTVGTAFQWLGAVIVNAVNSLVQAVDFADAVPDFSVPVPTFQDGGIQIGPGLAMLGDNPSGVEAVVPLERAGEFGFGGRSREDNEKMTELLRENNSLMRTFLETNNRWWE